MSDCVPIPGTSTCCYCGWTWRKPTPFPRRNCPNHPAILKAASEAAEKLGVTDEKEIARIRSYLARWAAAGFPERTQAEQDACLSACGLNTETPCKYARPMSCNYDGCGGKKHRPMLIHMLRMATVSCPDKSGDRWAEATHSK